MTNRKECDICVLGGGGAGIAAARAAAALGAKVVLVEKRNLGGAYLAQIIPAEAFCAAAMHMAPARDPRFDLSSAPRKIEFPALRARVISVIKDFSRDYAPGTLTAQNIDIVRSVGSFSRSKRLEAGGYAIEAKHFILAHGAVPASIAIPGWELIRPLALEDLLSLDRPPPSLIIVGATYLGLTLAQAFLRLGTEVSLIEPGPVLPKDDPELVRPILTSLAREGLRLHAGLEIAGVEPANPGARLFLKGAPAGIEGAQILFAGSPAPLLEGLGLKNAGITYANSGILTDAHGRTSNGRAYVVGNAGGGPDSAHSAIVHAERLARALVMGSTPNMPAARVLATDPEMATVGLTEAQAREKHRAIRVLRGALAETERARLAGRSIGHVKIVTNPAGIVLGAGAVGPAAREFIGLFALAIAEKIKVGELDFVANAPAFAVAITRAALASHPQLGKVRLRRPFLPRQTR